jgi:DNA-directed RNA polymerase subunit RPC12/RpoP
MAQNERSGGDGRGEERESSGQSSESDDLNHRVRCEYCGNALRRLARQGFMQQEIYSRFGYYPWECPLCREPMMVRQQHRLKKRVEDESEAMGPGTARSGAS